LIIVAIGFIFLSAWAFDVVLRKHGKLNTFLNIFIFAAILESVALSWAYMAKAPPERAFVSPQILAYLAEDDGQGRVFCPSLCISQRGAQDYNLELVQGYSTLTQSNYMSAMVGYTNFFWDYYSLATPPFGAHRAVEFVPNIELLGENNVRYLVLTSRVEIDGLVAVAEDEGYYVYENEFYRPRASADIEYYSPNKLTLNTSAFLGSEGLLVRDTYSPGWVAHDSEGRVLSVQETPEHHRSVGLIDKTESVTMEYAPPGYGQGKRITAFTVLALATYGLIKWRRLL
jgi:hypothetical protein